jgi:putative peptidoglycan lipid II flippase
MAVAPTVLAFASGLPAFSLSKVFQPGFYAREDTRTPMQFALVSVLVNVAGSLVLSHWMGHVGIALATSIAAWVNAGLLGFTLSRRGLFSLDERCRKRLPRILASSLLMGGLLLAGAWLLSANYAEQAGFLAAAWGLLLLVTGGALSFFAIAHVSGAMRLGEIKTMLKR